MINILMSLFVFAAVKIGFLWAFAPRHDRGRAVADTVRCPEPGAGLVERHDRRAIGPSIRSEMHELTCALITRESDARAFSLRAAEQFVEGQ